MEIYEKGKKESTDLELILKNTIKQKQTIRFENISKFDFCNEKLLII